MTTHEDQIMLTRWLFWPKPAARLDAFRTQLKQAANLHATSFVECRYYGSEVLRVRLPGSGRGGRPDPDVVDGYCARDQTAG